LARKASFLIGAPSWRADGGFNGDVLVRFSDAACHRPSSRLRADMSQSAGAGGRRQLLLLLTASDTDVVHWVTLAEVGQFEQIQNRN